MCASISIFISRYPYVVYLIQILIGFFLIRHILKKYPPYIEKKDKSLDVLIVHAPQIYRFSIDYNTYTYVKKKNGKYRIKLSLLSLLSIVISLGAFIFIIFGLLEAANLGSDYEYIIFSIALFLMFAPFFIILHFSKIVALICFKKLVKKLKQKSKHRH